MNLPNTGELNHISTNILVSDLSIGYKMRRHIAKALHARSKAVHAALEVYNQAAAVLDPPRPELPWAVVAEYTFIAEFDLLKLSRCDIRKEPWAVPTG